MANCIEQELLLLLPIRNYSDSIHLYPIYHLTKPGPQAPLSYLVCTAKAEKAEDKATIYNQLFCWVMISIDSDKIDLWHAI